MNEKVYHLTQAETKTIEKNVLDEHVNLMHFILPLGEGAPIHVSNANLYMVVLRGTLSITLGKNPTSVYEKGQILNIPYGLLMNFRNEHQEVLELLVIKAPVPGSALYTNK
jgi:quercetin dioxygenase-like cupin family protein